MKPVRSITDRAKRYRAQQNRPRGKKLCNFCGSRKNVDVDHITGNESDGEPDNLIYLCRPCNVRKGIVQARNKIGVRTVQFNPLPRSVSFTEFQNSAAILMGVRKGDAARATAAVRATSPAKRAEFGERMTKNPAPDFKQYLRAVVIHERGAHDEGGAIIHATPPALRSEYAREIAALKASRRGKMKSMNPERRNLSDDQFRDMKKMLAGLTPAERKTLHDPNFITEDEAAGIFAMRSTGPYYSVDEVLSSVGMKRRRLSA